MANHQTEIELETCLTTNPQENLISAFKKKDLSLFKYALSQQGAVADEIIKGTKLSIFDTCCQTPLSHDFIKACLDGGCDVNHYNVEMTKYPINFAAESMALKNIQILLAEPNINVNSQWETLTALHRIIKYLTKENFEEGFEIIKLLIKHHADVNIPDRKMVTPIVTAAKLKFPEAEKVVEYILNNTNVDIDKLRNGEARKLITKTFPHLSLPNPPSAFGEKSIDYYSLIELIKEKKEDKFVKDLKEFMQTPGDQDNKTNIFLEDCGYLTMLQLASEAGLLEIIKALVEAGADVNFTKTNSWTPVGYACQYGYYKVLEYFMQLPQIILKNRNDPLLCNTVKKLGEEYGAHLCDYTKCFELLLRSPDIDVNEEDVSGCTALHYAVKYKNEYAIMKLLEHSAFIGTENRFHDLPITDINPRVLEKYFDSCITANTKRPGDTDYEIIFDYRCLNPTKKSEPKTRQITRHVEEMKPIDYLAKTTELRYLVKHPLISSFLWLKWHRLGMIFYTNFFLYTLFCLSFISYVVCCYCYEHEVSRTVSGLLYTLSVFGVLYVVIREIIQFIMSPTNYFKTPENYLELALIIVTIIVLFGDGFDLDDQRVIAAIAILLVAAEFSLLVGSLPIMSISTHMVMLKTVSISFMKSLTLYSIIIVSFALCFYKLIGGQGMAQRNASQGNSTDISEDGKEEEEPFNKFLDPGTAIIKTIVMLTGEFEAANIDFENSYTSYIIFLLFVFFISIVLLNLLNGLAVSDTQAIKSEAELTGFIYRAQLLSRYEKIILGKWLHKYRSMNPISLFPKFLPKNTIILRPNDNNKVCILHPTPMNSKSNSHEYLIDIPEKTEKKLLHSPMEPLSCCFCNQRCSRMDGKILKYARNVLENKKRAEEDNKEKLGLKERMREIEKSVKSIESKMIISSENRDELDLKQRMIRIEENVESIEKMLREILRK